jgi:hypothetical protein
LEEGGNLAVDEIGALHEKTPKKSIHSLN